MARGDRLNAALARRITDSIYELTVHYPPNRPAPAGSTATSAPTSPLTGTRPTPTIYPATQTPSQPSVSMKCLWLDSYVGDGASANAKISVNRVGWLAGAQALARVLVEDAAVDPDNPWGDTVFTACENVGFMMHRYKVLAIEPIGNSFAKPLTYHVWLHGAQKQS